MITDWHLTELFSKLLLWLKMFRNFITCIFQNLTDIYQTLEEFLIRKKTIWFTALVNKDYKNFGRINSNLNSNPLMKKMNWKSRTTFKIKSWLLLNYDFFSYFILPIFWENPTQLTENLIYAMKAFLETKIRIFP